MRSLSRFAWATLVVNIAVIVFGAYVRATGSGAGCGASWPTCNGEVFPSALDGARAVEFTHRMTSGLALIMVAILLWRVWRTFPSGHLARRGAVLSAVFIIGEALIGAVIVLYEWVAEDASVARTVAVPLHLVNTLLLLAALTVTVWWVSGGGPLRLANDRPLARRLLVAAAGVMLIAATGSITALADTLFPSASVTEGLRESFTAAEHFLTNLRVVHPFVAIAMGAYLGWLAWTFGGASGSRRSSSLMIVGLVAAQFIAGALNVALLTPVWLQLLHLLLADVLWVALVIFAAETLSEQVAPAQA